MARVSDKFVEQTTNINYVDDGGFETSAASAFTYDDGGAYVDGTGGSPTAVTISRNTTTPLVGTGDLQIAKAASSASGEGVSIKVKQIDPVNRGKRLWISFDFDGTAANYVSNDVKLYAYDITNAELLSVIPVQGASQDTTNNVPQLPNLRTKVLAYVVPKSTCAQLRFSLHILTDNASGSAYNLFVDTVKVSVDGEVPGAIQSPWQSYTPTMVGFGTTTGVEFRWRRNGSDVEIAGRFTAGTTTATEARIPLPPGLTSAGTDVIPAIRQCGTFAYNSNSASFTSALIEPSVTYITLGLQNASNSGLTKAIGTTFGSSTLYTVWATVPIANWSASAALSTTEIGYQTVQVIASKNSGTHTSNGAYQDVSWTESVDNFNAFDGTTFTVPKSGRYQVHSGISFATNATGVRGLAIFVNGTAVLQSPIVAVSVSNTGPSIVSGILNLTRGDLVKVQAYQNSGGNLNYDSSATAISRFSISEIPDFTIFSTLFDNSDVELYLDSGNGRGSTNTSVMRFSNTRKNTLGQYATYADSATLGGSVTINVPGLYFIQVCDNVAGVNPTVAITVNSTALTTTAGSITYAQGKRSANIGQGTGESASCATTLRLNAGDVVRAQCGLNNPGTADNTIFQIVRVGN